MPLHRRSIRIPVLVLAGSVVAGVVLMTVNITNALGGADLAPAIRSDIRMALATVITVMAIWIAVALVLERQGQILRDVAMLRRQVDMLDVTQPLTPPLVAVGSVRVSAAATVPAAPDNVRPIDSIGGLSPEMIEAGRRLSRKIRGADE